MIKERDTQKQRVMCKFSPEFVHLTERTVAVAGAAVVAAALDPGSPQTIKLANVFQALKPLGSDSAVTLALTEAYWSCFQSLKEQTQVPGLFRLF